MAIVLHLTSVDRWSASQEAGFHSDPSLEAEGFIHCSNVDQIVSTANRFFEGRTDLVVLLVDTDVLTSPLVYEDTSGHGEFPHLYGPLDLDAVVDAMPFPSGPDGFRLPPALAT